MFILGVAVLFQGGVVLPNLSDRDGMEYVDALLPEPIFFEFDLGNIKRPLGYNPRHGIQRVVETPEGSDRG